MKKTRFEFALTFAIMIKVVAAGFWLGLGLYFGASTALKLDMAVFGDAGLARIIYVDNISTGEE